MGASVVLMVVWGGRGDSVASAMMADPEKIVTEPPSSVTVTVIGVVPLLGVGVRRR